MDNRLQYKCQDCSTYSYKPLNPLKERFKNTYEFCKHDNNKFLLLLRKGVYPYKYMDSFERLKETSLPEYENFYSEWGQSNITKRDYEHAQKVWTTFSINNMKEFQDLYVKSDTLQLADIFENFRNMCIETYQLDHCYFVSVPGFAWEACLNKTEQEFELLTNMNM